MAEAADRAWLAFSAMPTTPDCLTLFIHQMLRLERRAEAREVILEVIQRGVEDANLYNALGELCFYDDLFEESKAHFRRAAELGLASAFNNLGVIHFKLSEFEQARQAFEQCLGADPNHVGAQRNLQKLLKLTGQPESPPPDPAN